MFETLSSYVILTRSPWATALLANSRPNVSLALTVKTLYTALYTTLYMLWCMMAVKQKLLRFGGNVFQPVRKQVREVSRC